jgi:uncharacterized protein YgbK (DUF1537 family)
MILVIADDFSGAAEIGGVGLRYGLKSVIRTDNHFDPDYDILIFDTNTRSATAEDAQIKISKLSESLMKKTWQWIYKKTDSVLRGHVVSEISSILKYSGKHNVLLIPQNPGVGRSITNGLYLINDTPLHLTEFVSDPDFPRKTSHVLDLLGTSDTFELRLAEPGSKISKNSITVGAAQNGNDIYQWTKQLQSETIPAGGAEFFDAILKSKGLDSNRVKKNHFDWENKKVLIVCGSTSIQYTQLINRLNKEVFVVCNVPCAISEINDHYLKQWQDKIVEAFSKTGKVVLTIEQSTNPVYEKPGRLLEFIAELTARVLDLVRVEEIFVEGGDTASFILRFIGWNCLIPLEEWGPGVVRMKISGEPSINLTTKPGSYSWPDL